MATVTDYQFAIGNGVADDFTVMDPDGGAATNPVISTLYRKDWQEVTLSPAARTNLSTYSKDLSNWSGMVGATIGTNSALGPNGEQTADTLVENSGTSTHYRSSNIVVLADNTSYCIQVDVKRVVGTRNVEFYAYNKAAAQYGGLYNLGTGAVTSVLGGATAGIVELPGWGHRIWFVLPSGAGANTPQPSVLLLSGPSTTTYTGDGVSSLAVVNLNTIAGTTPSSAIDTTTAPVALTDYVLTGNALALGEVPAVGALLSWSGTDDNLVSSKHIAGMPANMGTLMGRA